MGVKTPQPACASIAVLQAPLAATVPCPHAWGLGRSGGGSARTKPQLVPLRRSGDAFWSPPPKSRQPGAARVVGAAFLAGAAVLVLVAAVVVAAGAAVVAGDRAGACSPVDSATSRQRVLITPSRAL